MGRPKKAITIEHENESTVTSKIEKTKVAAINIISQRGFGSTSVANIATEANVSVGYLYRHYAGKQELVNDVIADMYKDVLQNTKEILEMCRTAEDVCNQVIRYHFQIYKHNPEKVKFLVMLLNDFGINTYSEQKRYITEISELFFSNFIKKKGARKTITIDELYIALVVIPLQSLALRLRKVMLDSSTEEDVIETIKNISLKIVQG